MDATSLKAELSKRCRLSVGQLPELSGRVCSDSRLVQPGDVFVAVRGVNVDGHDYIKEVERAGAALVVSQKPVSVLCPQITASNSAAELGRLAQAAAGNPSKRLDVLGVTGTNGKTTVAYLVRAMLAAGRRRCGMVGTVEYDLGGKVIAADNTTPGQVRLAELMAEMVGNRMDSLVTECSSHGLDQSRLAGVEFKAAAFTNLTGDHLDYHGDIIKYRQAKVVLFRDLAPEATAVINACDQVGDYMAKSSQARIWRFGVGADVDISGVIIESGLWGCRVELKVLSERLEVSTPLIGEHNVSNALAAVGLARAVGVSLEDIATALEGFAGAPGRLERIDCGQDFTVLVDYAHTDDALRHALSAIKKLEPQRVIAVFGCGGDRDRSKRPRMAAAAQCADVIIVTNDNPRSEDPGRIIADIRAGFTKECIADVTEIPSRYEAIEFALTAARSGDAVLIAGKGHEDYQLMGGKKLHFDDRETVRKILNEKSYASRE